MDDVYIPLVGEHVSWLWYGRVIYGVVKEICPEKTLIHSKGKIITRNGTPENPAIIISHISGNDVLKLASELTRLAR